MVHRFRGISRAPPTRDLSMTRYEQTTRMVGLAWTMFTLNDETSEGMIPIANVYQVCAPSLGRAPITVSEPS